MKSKDAAASKVSSGARRGPPTPVAKFWRDYLHFLRTEPEWWLLPFILILLGLFGLAWLGESQPSFIYPLF